jgi:hypothetical protein
LNLCPQQGFALPSQEIIMAQSLARFTVKRTLDDSFILHIEDDSGTAFELDASYDQLDLITEAIEEALETDVDEEEELADDSDEDDEA